MQDDTLFDSTRNELLERLQALEGPQASGSLAELAYRRAREALEKALDEARTIRLQAIDDARNHRERELTALAESLSNFRMAAERQIEELLREAELEAERLRDEARDEARQVVQRATADTASMRAEAAALRAAAEDRVREVEAMEAGFDEVIEQIGKRLGMQGPKKPWFRKERYTQ
jgi:vacuolar-type H+-ATPase subunit E/Vma4